MARSIPIYFMGKEYRVPEGITILSAIEYAGYQLIRGCGCRGGFCGACATVYRVPGDYSLKVGLACQTQIEEGMTLTVLPFYPAQKPKYNLDAIDDPFKTLRELFPEIYRCLGCNSCTKVCPQDLQVMDYIAAAQRGDFYKVAELSFDCIMCGLCASRCLAQMVPYHIALYARRAYAKTALKKPPYVDQRIEEINQGKYDPQIDRLLHADLEVIKEAYAQRDLEEI